ncbi:RnfH family protein [Sulfuriflexus mobilis]|uniref:RnfH family protein n=1 Tax=Sulfuriflexus mobilis TaxID=1811807 RepID=UPI000F843B15|nr:RnfH family protein [Sulfuriflexus mobilis]
MENADTPSRINIEVAYALPDKQQLIALQVEAGTTIEQAIQQSGILEQFPQIDLANSKVGIFGKLKKADVPVREGERVEIYRPLIADPKVVRKQRAAEGKRMRKGGGDAKGVSTP